MVVKYLRIVELYFIEKTDSFELALDKLLYHSTEFVDLDKMHRFVFNQAYFIDGNASRRISDLIRSMISEYIKI